MNLIVGSCRNCKAPIYVSSLRAFNSKCICIKKDVGTVYSDGSSVSNLSQLSDSGKYVNYLS